MKKECFEDTVDQASQKEIIEEALILLSQVLEYDSMLDVDVHSRWVEEFLQRNSEV